MSPKRSFAVVLILCASAAAPSAFAIALLVPQLRAQPGQHAGAEYLRRAYDTYRSMVQSSPYRAIDWQPLGPTNITGRATDVAVAEKNGARPVMLVGPRGCQSMARYGDDCTIDRYVP